MLCGDCGQGTLTLVKNESNIHLSGSTSVHRSYGRRDMYAARAPRHLRSAPAAGPVPFVDSSHKFF